MSEVLCFSCRSGSVVLHGLWVWQETLDSSLKGPHSWAWVIAVCTGSWIWIGPSVRPIDLNVFNDPCGYMKSEAGHPQRQVCWTNAKGPQRPFASNHRQIVLCDSVTVIWVRGYEYVYASKENLVSVRVMVQGAQDPRGRQIYGSVCLHLLETDYKLLP